MFNEKLFTKDIKMPSSKAWVCYIQWSMINEGVEHKGLEVSLRTDNKIRECCVRANICNQSQLLCDIYITGPCNDLSKF
jgi:hypothetical protein